MSKIKNGGLDQYGAEPFEQQQCGTAGVERINTVNDARKWPKYMGGGTGKGQWGHVPLRLDLCIGNWNTAVQYTSLW